MAPWPMEQWLSKHGSGIDEMGRFCRDSADFARDLICEQAAHLRTSSPLGIIFISWTIRFGKRATASSLKF
jgi:hypothetical protein